MTSWGKVELDYCTGVGLPVTCDDRAARCGSRSVASQTSTLSPALVPPMVLSVVLMPVLLFLLLVLEVGARRGREHTQALPTQGPG